MEKTVKLNSVISAVSGLLAAALFIYSLILVFVMNFSAALLMSFALGAVFASFCVIFRVFRHKKLFTTKIILFSGSALLIFMLIFLPAYGAADNATYQENALIVLGSGIRGEEPSDNLKARLDTAVAYHQKNPAAIIVVSGGQGPQEDITEALSMERYLVSAGIPREMILREDAAASTNENFTFSKAILDSRFGGSCSVCFITNDYHILRATGVAEAAGFSGATHCHSGTAWYTLVPNTLREYLAIIKYAIFGG